MNDREQRDAERAARLLAFVKGEITDLSINVRLQFILDLFNHLRPEVDELVRKGRIEGLS